MPNDHELLELRQFLEQFTDIPEPESSNAPIYLLALHTQAQQEIATQLAAISSTLLQLFDMIRVNGLPVENIH